MRMGDEVMKTLEQVVEQMKGELLSDVMGKIVPVRVTNFAELHDYVDANCYGGFCADNGITDELIAAHGGRDPAHGGMPQAALDFINAAQGAIDKWIKTGGLETLVDDQDWEGFGPYAYGELIVENKRLKRENEAPRPVGAAMKPYTVLLCRPDTSWCDNACLEWVEALNVEAAQEAARYSAWVADTPEDERAEIDEDDAFDQQQAYRVLCVIEGHHCDVSRR